MYKSKKTNFESVSLLRRNMNTHTQPCFKNTYGYKYIIRVSVVTLPCAPSRSDILGLPPAPTSDQNVPYVLGWALDQVQRPAAESVSKWITLTKFLYRTCGVKRCWVRAVYIQTRSLSHQRREGAGLSYWICTSSRLRR